MHPHVEEIGKAGAVQRGKEGQPVLADDERPIDPNNQFLPVLFEFPAIDGAVGEAPLDATVADQIARVLRLRVGSKYSGEAAITVVRLGEILTATISASRLSSSRIPASKADDLAPDDFRRQVPRFQAENFDANAALVAALEQLAASKGVTAAQLALAWVLSRGDDIVPIPGARKLHHLEQNVTAADIELSPEEVEQLNNAIPAGQVAGMRYSEASLAMTNL